MTTDALPAPLTPADCDLQDFKFMPLDVARLRDSDLASEQTPEENWAAVLLWAAAWHQVPCGSVPDSDNWLAKAAGYMSRGRIDPHWKDVRVGAMRGFVLCSDGRWYHQVVSEKANESWIGKLRQRLKTECARIKKHNDRHGTKVRFPEFDAWFAAGCPVGQPLPVPSDNLGASQGTGGNVPSDTTPVSPSETTVVPTKTPSKGQGEGQGEGQLTTKAEDSISATVPDYDPPRNAPLPMREALPLSDDPAIQMSVVLRRLGVDVYFTNPWVQEWVAKGVTFDMLTVAVERARAHKGDSTIPPKYLAPIVNDLLNPPPAAAAPAGRPPRAPTPQQASQANTQRLIDRLNRKPENDPDDTIIDINERPA